MSVCCCLFCYHLSLENFGYTLILHLILWPMQPSIQWILGLCPQGSSQIMKLITHLHLVLGLRMHEALTPLSLCIFITWCLSICILPVMNYIFVLWHCCILPVISYNSISVTSFGILPVFIYGSIFWEVAVFCLLAITVSFHDKFLYFTYCYNSILWQVAIFCL